MTVAMPHMSILYGDFKAGANRHFVCSFQKKRIASNVVGVFWGGRAFLRSGESLNKVIFVYGLMSLPAGAGWSIANQS
jgi:hypothetical protein